MENMDDLEKIIEEFGNKIIEAENSILMTNRKIMRNIFQELKD